MIAQEAFPAEPASIRAARQLISTHLGDLETEQVECLQLMVSELATNALRHADAPFHIAISRSDATLRVEVSDQGPGTPVMGSPDPAMPSGRGLYIVDVLADSWGVDEHLPQGKSVWFTLQLAEQGGSAQSAPDRADASL